MACNDIRDLISAVLDKRATADERARLAQHLTECVACRAEVRELEAVDAALKSLPAPTPPDGYEENFVARLTMKIDEQAKDEAQEKKEPKEDSGLLEIRKMASRDITAQREAVRKSEAMEAVAAVSVVDIPASVSQPHVIVPPKPQAAQRRGWVIPVAAVGGLVVVAGVVFAMLQGSNKPEIVRAPEPGAPPPPVAAAFDPSAQPASAPSASQPTVAAAGPAVAMAPNVATPAKAAEPEHAEKRAAKAKAEGGAAEAAPKAPKEAKPAAEPKAPAEARPAGGEKDLIAGAGKPEAKPGKKGDQLDELLGSGPRKEEKKAEPGEDLPETLSQAQIKTGMTSVKGRVMACLDKYDVSGRAILAVTIGRQGKITSATVKGMFAGTPTGDCVSAAVKTASFPKFKGKSISFDYPYLLMR
jgi:hypothetical protein